MLFCSNQFAVFFAIVFVAYWLLRWHEGRIGLLLAASFYFYASWNHWLALLIFGTSIVDWAVGRGLDASRNERLRKLLLLGSLVVNIGLLCWFKYANFFLSSVEDALRAAGSSASLPVLQVILPVGISFYTFEAINYTVDVYRRKAPAERNLAHFLLFITFFPHLVAGPIVRARAFLPQLRRRKRWSWARVNLGVALFVMGYFKKMAVADRMAMFVDPVFDSPMSYNSHALWLAVLAYAIQIYCDFSGYTDMALGSAHLLGYKLALNFNMPYLAVNISDFWKRWHISLSSWLRDYLFIPLGGSRGTRWQTARNLLITMTLGGLWHGASWTFVVWGAVHGGFLIVHRAFAGFCKDRPWLDGALQSAAGTAARAGLTFLCVALTWVLFRAPTFDTALTIFERLFVYSPGWSAPLHNRTLWYTVVLLAVCHWAATSGAWRKYAIRLPAVTMGLGYACVVLLAQVLTPLSDKVFIYFQF